jgi:carbonic anhydrase
MQHACAPPIARRRDIEGGPSKRRTCWLRGGPIANRALAWFSQRPIFEIGSTEQWKRRPRRTSWEKPRPARHLDRKAPNMNSLRSTRLILSLAMSTLTLADCAAETPRPAVPRSAVSPVVEAAAWMEPAPAPEPGEEGSEAAVAAHLAMLQVRPHWAYQGDEGPASWGELSPDYEACKTGASQSPIDIATRTVEADKALELIDFGYASVPLHMLNDGHTVQVANTTPAAINAGGDTWKLAHLDFHSPSEHSINGKFADLELQLAHVNRLGELAVVALLFKKGRENRALAPVFDAMRADLTSEAQSVPGAAVDLSNVVPPAPSYFTYVGSLTTPDCTEGVRWFVLEPIGEISEAQLRKLRAVIPSDTNRPVQPLGSRKILRPE